MPLAAAFAQSARSAAAARLERHAAVSRKALADSVAVLAGAPDGDDEISGEIFTVAEQMPVFPGGYAALMSWLRDNIRYPADAKAGGVTGRVVVCFVVEPDGTVSHARVQRSVHPSLDAEALRVVGSMPRWIPGKRNGKCIRVRYRMPVTFRL